MIPKETEDDNPKNFFKAASSSYIPASSSWTRLKDPRIVRVSRAFGGKDRHSKVCTVRGLRDRRVRLSVPTAIQLYDLQDRLGLNQPSKVVDWLLNVAKNEIEELPPLQIPQGSFSSMISTFQAIGTSSSPKIGSSFVNWNDPPEHSRSVDNLFGGKPNKDNRDETWRSEDQERRQFDNSLEHQGALLYASPSNNNTHSSLQIPYNNSFVRWDASNVLTLSHHHDQPPKSNGLITQNEDWHNFSLQLPNVVYQTGIMNAPVAQSYFASQISARDSGEFDPKEVNYRSSQLSSSSQLNTANLLPSQNNDGS